MLTSLKVSGFKNLNDCEVMFGPFTCIAGANGAGKSNLFDVIGLLKNLSQMTLVDAFSKIRNEEGQRSNNLASVFFKTEAGYSDLKIEAEFIVKSKNTDDFGRTGSPNSSFLRYTLKIKYIPANEKERVFENIELCHEELTYIAKGEAVSRVCFKINDELKKAIQNNKTTKYISTKNSKINLHQDSSKDKDGRGRASEFPTQGATRTVLSTINSYDTPTALAAKREMQSWLQLQLEPSSLRAYDNFKDSDKLDEYGRHLPGALNRLKQNTQIANKVAMLVPGISSVNVDIDEKRETKTLEIVFKHAKKFTANNLSDGTLRFIALSALALDKNNAPVICMEEPENGIHPEKIPALLNLLQEIGYDLEDEIDDENPLRQIIINTHSPVVVKNLKIENILFAENYNIGKNEFVRYVPIQTNKRKNVLTKQYVSKATLIKYLGRNKSKITSAVSDIETVGSYITSQTNLDFES